MMQALYVETDSWLHRLSPRLKLALLAALGVLLFVTDSLWLPAACGLAGALIYFRLGLPWKAALARLRPVFLTIAVVAAFSLVFNPWHQAALALLRLSALTLFAASVTATTSISAFIDEITALATPLERIGLVRASDIGLAVGLVIRFVPEIIVRYEAIREAHAARGIKLRVTTAMIPLIILTLRDADNVAAAIDARGIRGHVKRS